MFGGYSIDEKKLAEIRAMGPRERSTAVHTALIENDPTNRMWSHSQMDTAAKMLDALIETRRVAIGSGEIKTIIKLARDSW